MEQRTRVGKGTKPWDVVWAVLFGPLFFPIHIVAGFDAVRCRWTVWMLRPEIFLVEDWQLLFLAPFCLPGPWA